MMEEASCSPRSETKYLARPRWEDGNKLAEVAVEMALYPLPSENPWLAHPR